MIKQKTFQLLPLAVRYPEQVTAWVGRNDYEYGKVTAIWLAEKMVTAATLLLFGCRGQSVAENAESAKDVFDQHPGSKC